MKISIVLSLYNESKHIAMVIHDVHEFKLPVIVVDDGSSDGSNEIVAKTYTTLLTHRVNLGKGAAMETGAEYAFSHGADAIIFMDSDGQHAASDLPKFVSALESKKYDLIFGSRNLNFGVPLIRYLGNKFASFVIGMLFHIYVTDAICGFRALTKAGYKKIKWESDTYGVETEMVARAGKAKLPIFEVPVETIYHNNVKGVTILDAFGILGQVVKWKLTI